jgi:hypothetical protein
MNFERFTKMITNLDTARRNKNIDFEKYKQVIDEFISEFGLLDFREFRPVAPEQAAA